jgi:hypothetical protein
MLVYRFARAARVAARAGAASVTRSSAHSVPPRARRAVPPAPPSGATASAATAAAALTVTALASPYWVASCERKDSPVDAPPPAAAAAEPPSFNPDRLISQLQSAPTASLEDCVQVHSSGVCGLTAELPTAADNYESVSWSSYTLLVHVAAGSWRPWPPTWRGTLRWRLQREC